MFYYTKLTPSLHGDIPRSKKVTKRYRRTIAKDRKALAITRVLTPLAVSAAARPSVPIATPLPTPANDDHKAPSETHGVVPLLGGRKSEEKSPKAARQHVWEHTTDLGKITSAYRVIDATDEGYAFTLNCSPDEIAAAQRHPKGFTDYFKRGIDRALRRALGDVPLYGFGVDVAKDDRPHIHGAIAANDNQLEAIDKALCHVGGKWASTRHSDKQCELKALYTPDVWANYCLRHQARVRRVITGRTISITTPLRRRAKARWSLGSPITTRSEAGRTFRLDGHPAQCEPA
jgi:hypothetical protein